MSGSKTKFTKQIQIVSHLYVQFRTRIQRGRTDSSLKLFKKGSEISQSHDSNSIILAFWFLVILEVFISNRQQFAHTDFQVSSSWRRGDHLCWSQVEGSRPRSQRSCFASEDYSKVMNVT